MGKVVSIAKWRKTHQSSPSVPDVSELVLQGHNVGGEQAVSLYREAIRLDPKCADAYLNLGVELYRASRTVGDNLGLLKEARACWRKVIKLSPDTGKAYYNLAFTYIVDGYTKASYIKAEGLLILAMERAQDDEVRLDALYALGQVYLKLDRKKAWVVYQRYLQLNSVGEDADKAREILARISVNRPLRAPTAGERSLTLVK